MGRLGVSANSTLFVSRYRVYSLNPKCTGQNLKVLGCEKKKTWKSLTPGYFSSLTVFTHIPVHCEDGQVLPPLSSLLLALSWPTSRYLSSFWWHSSWYENSNFRSTSQVEERVIAVPVVQPGAISKETSQANRVSSAGSSWRNGNALHDYYVHICQGVMSCWCNICCTKRMTEHLRIVFPSKGLQLKMCFALTDIVFPRRGAGSPTNCTQQRPSHRIGPQNIAIF